MLARRQFVTSALAAGAGASVAESGCPARQTGPHEHLDELRRERDQLIEQIRASQSTIERSQHLLTCIGLAHRLTPWPRTSS